MLLETVLAVLDKTHGVCSKEGKKSIEHIPEDQNYAWNQWASAAPPWTRISNGVTIGRSPIVPFAVSIEPPQPLPLRHLSYRRLADAPSTAAAVVSSETWAFPPFFQWTGIVRNVCWCQPPTCFDL